MSPSEPLIDDALRTLLDLPPERQVSSARDLLVSWEHPLPEAWNSAFGPHSLFDAWCRTSVARSVHEAVWQAVGPKLTDGFVLIEVGGGDGATWRGRFPEGTQGTLVVVDPVAEVHERVRASVPSSIDVVAMQLPVQHAELPEADVVVCSLTLHHVAGRSAEERARHGMGGPGKREVLQAFAEAVAARSGLVVLVEADVHCEIDLPPGDPQLADRIFDSYVRRCARSILEDLQTRGPQEEADLVGRWRALLHHWFLGQLAVVDLPLAERDVYELTVPQWLQVIDEAGLAVIDHGFVDDLPLFHRYLLGHR